MNKKKRAQALIEYLSKVKDEEGYAVIDVNLKDGVEIYNPLSTPENRDLNRDIYDYIESQTNVIPSSVPLRVRFHGVPETEQEEIKRDMNRHYTLKSLDVSWDLAASLRKALFLIAFGVVVLALYFYFSFTSNNFFFAEILSIVGSFSLWEAADTFLLERPSLKREVKNIEQNLNQLIEFIP